jgi:hypothetical protein
MGNEGIKIQLRYLARNHGSNILVCGSTEIFKNHLVNEKFGTCKGKASTPLGISNFLL